MEQIAGHNRAIPPDPLHGINRAPAGALPPGLRRVQYQCCVSLLVITFQFRTAAYLTESARARFLYGLAYSLMTLAFGPWGIPWGPILTARAIWVNLGGGVDMNAQTLSLPEGGEPVRSPVSLDSDR
jgi:hypothetical protein